MTSTFKGIVLSCIGGLYGVRLVCSDGTHQNVRCRARGHFRHNGISPLPGDDVSVLSEDGAGATEYVIDDVLPRRGELIRPPMANLTHLFLLIPACRPTPDLLTADKLCAIAEHAGVIPVIVIGKSDIDPDSSAHIAEIYRTAGFDTFQISAVTGDGVERLGAYIDSAAEDGVAVGCPVRAAFAGVSGAGKSTLMSRLFPDLNLVSGDVSRKTARGRHTTRSVELFSRLTDSGAEFYLADTPGFSMIDFTRYNFFPASELAESFREFRDCIGECRYKKCTHTKEEGCAVLRKMENGGIDSSRHQSYVAIYDELKSKPEWKRQKEEAALTSRRRR